MSFWKSVNESNTCSFYAFEFSSFQSSSFQPSAFCQCPICCSISGCIEKNGSLGKKLVKEIISDNKQFLENKRIHVLICQSILTATIDTCSRNHRDGRKRATY